MCLQELIRILIEHEPGADIRLIAPESLKFSAPVAIVVTVKGTDTQWSTLKFEQRQLPSLVEDMDADVLLMPYIAAPLSSRVPVVVLGSIDLMSEKNSIQARLLRAFRVAGVHGASRKLLYPELYPDEDFDDSGSLLDPWVHNAFRTLPAPRDQEMVSRHELPSSYVLTHGVSLQDIPTTLAAWTWVDGSIGDNIPLVSLVSCGAEAERWKYEKKRLDLAHSVRVLEDVDFDGLPALYRRAEGLLLGGRGIQPQVLRWAMAVGLPVTAFDMPLANQVLGAAGYLVEPGDTRALGAACLTLIVEPDVHDRLRKASLELASKFHQSTAPAIILEVLRRAAASLMD